VIALWLIGFTGLALLVLTFAAEVVGPALRRPEPAPREPVFLGCPACGDRSVVLTSEQLRSRTLVQCPKCTYVLASPTGYVGAAPGWLRARPHDRAPSRPTARSVDVSVRPARRG